jgi:glucose/arabinose dehydrogenase
MQKLIYLRLLIIIAIPVMTCCNKKKSANDVTITTGDSIRVLKNNLQHVWEIAWGPDNHIWFTERDGKISKMNPADGSIVFSSVITEVESSGEGGLLAIAIRT